MDSVSDSIAHSANGESTSQYSAAEIQIVDLQPFIQSELNQTYEPDPEGTADYSYDAGVLSELIPDEELYSRYLNGLISFDDLMREMHRTESGIGGAELHIVQPEAVESDAEVDDSSDESSDPDYVPPQRKLPGVDSVRKTRTRNKLSVELAQYLGEAERHLNSNEFVEAEKICRNIISTAPNSSAPYVVLGEVYYRRGDQEKSREYLFEAAKRDPTNVNLWTSLVDFAEEKGDLALATYYTKLALRSAKHAVDLRRRLIQYCEKAGRTREALLLRVSALTISPEASGPQQFQLARSLADEFFKLGDRNGSVRAYESAFEIYPDSGTDADKNIPLSMMLQMQKYENALKFFLRFCGVTIKTDTGKILRWDRLTEQLKRADQYTECTYSSTLPPELYLKLFVVMIHLKLTNACMHLVRMSFTDETAENFSDWLLDIIKCYRSLGLHSAAGELLTKLTTLDSTKKFPHVWIMLAETQVEDGSVDDAIKSYRHVIDTLAPRHAEARVALSNLLNRVGRSQEALNLLKPSSLPQQRTERERHHSKRKSTRSNEWSREKLTDRVSLVEQQEEPSVSLMEFAESSKGGEADDLNEFDSTIEDDSEEEDVTDPDDEDEVEEARAQARFLQSSESISDATLMSHDPVAYRMAFERCRMLDHPSTLDAFIDDAWNLLFTDVARFCGPYYFHLVFLLESSRLRARLMQRLGTNDKAVHCVSEKIAVSKDRNVTNLDIWTLYLRLVDLLLARLPASLNHLEVAATWGYLLPAVYSDECRRAAVGNLLVSSSILAGHGALALVKLKEMYKQWSHSNQYWNLLNLACHLCPGDKHYRFLDRRLDKKTATFPLKLMSINDCIARGSYRFATARLIGLRETNPDDPLILLMLAVSFLSFALQRFAMSRHPPVLQAIGFLSEYRRARGRCQEVYYNIARACQQLSLGHMAVHYYEKVLAMEPVGETEEEKSYTDLRREAAFNLSLIYRSQGNFAMAHHLIQTYIVI